MKTSHFLDSGAFFYGRCHRQRTINNEVPQHRLHNAEGEMKEVK